jgi:hypothetical protein
MSASVKIIGICGYPEHGKSTAQRFLELLGVRSIDDSRPLREATMERYGLSWDDVTTQAGKKRVFRPEHGDSVTIRQALGDLGKEFEKEHGPNYWIERAIASIDGSSPVSFGSVRMGQAHAIREAGGLVLEIRNPYRPASEHDFDQYDPFGVEATILNDWSLWTLERRVVEAVADYLNVSANLHLLRRQQQIQIAAMVS